MNKPELKLLTLPFHWAGYQYLACLKLDPDQVGTGFRIG